MDNKYKKITLKYLNTFLQNRFEEGFLTLKDLPLPSTFKNMDLATKRVVEAIDNKEKITVVGDYDVDGVVSTSIMKLFFEEISYEIDWIIPNRFSDGYGLSPKVLDKIDKTDLIITVDNGISAVEAAQICKDRNIDLIITDHHLLPPKIPDAYAIIDQKQLGCEFEFDEICGAQIAWYFVASIKNALNIKIDMLNYLDLVSIAIIADVMPLKHINRAMVIYGLKKMYKSEKPSIKAFLEEVNKDSLTSEDIGFTLAPILNSAGRMDDAKFGVDFLTSKNIYDARVRLNKLLEFNSIRKETESKITKEAILQSKSDSEILVIDGLNWHEGVIGIVAARVANIKEKPTIILSENSDGVLKGSGRSFGDIDLFKVIDSKREYLDKFGGHKAAIGLSLKKDNLEDFKQSLNSQNIDISDNNFQDSNIVGSLDFNLISFDLISLINTYEPYGHGNHRPKFITSGIKILDIFKMGKKGEHIKFSFEQNGLVFNGIKFKTNESFNIGDIVTVTYTVTINNFRGNKSIQLMVDRLYR